MIAHRSRIPESPMRILPPAAATLALALALALPAAAQDYLSFRSPSGNIHCLIASWDGGYARCDLDDYHPSFPRAPVWCEQDYGFAFEVQATGPGGVLCAGDTVIDPGAGVLDYGRSVVLGGVSCSSARDGMTCTNREGHGFTVARAAQRVF